MPVVVTTALAVAVAGSSAGRGCGETQGVERFDTLGTNEVFNQSPRAVTVDGTLVYAADLYGLTIYDIQEPTAPERVGELLLPAAGKGVAVWGDYAFVADGQYGLAVVNVSDPSNPQLVSTYTPQLSFFDYMAVALSSDGRTAYLAAEPFGLEVIDVSNPASPQRIGGNSDPGAAGALTISGGYAYVCSLYTSSISIIRLSDLATVGTYSSLSVANGVAVDGHAQRLYVASGVGWSGSFEVVDVSDPGNPRRLGRCDLPGLALGVAVADGADTVEVADGTEGLKIVDVSRVDDPRVVGSLATGGTARDVALAGGDAVVADETAGLYVVDVGTPDAPVLLAERDTRGRAERVAVSGQYAYVADGELGLVVVDLSNPAAPDVAGRLDGLPDRAIAVTLSGDGTVAYVAEGVSGFEVVDVSTPTNPVSLGRYTLPAPSSSRPVSGIAERDGMVYLARFDDGLRIVEVSIQSGHALFTERGVLSDRYWARDVVVMGGVAFLACGSQGLLGIDVRNPDDPSLVWQWGGTDNSVLRLRVDGPYLLATDSHDGLLVFDASNPFHPVLLGSYKPEGIPGPLAAWGRVAWMTTTPSSSGQPRRLVLVDLTFPDAPVPITSTTTLRATSDIGLDAGTGTAWLAGEAILEGVDSGCPSCAGLGLEASPSTVPAGGSGATVTVTVRDPFGNPVPGQTVTGSATLGSLGAFTDQGDGTYTAHFDPGDVSGTATISVSVNGADCATTCQIEVTCPAGSPGPPVNLGATAQGSDAVLVSWEGPGGSPAPSGYRVYRGTWPLADLGPDQTSFTDTSLSPGTEYCYSVAALDACGGETPSGQSVCATTAGFARTCVEPAAVDALGFGADPRIQGVAMRGHYLATAGVYGLGIWDLSDPTAPVPAARWQAPAPAYDLTWAENGLIFLADGRGGLRILDPSDPSRPRPLGWYDCYALTVAVSGDGNTAYLACSDATAPLVILDVSDPSAPEVLKTVSWVANVQRLAVSGRALAVAQGTAGLHILDVGDPLHPVDEGILQLDNREAYDVVFDGTTAYYTMGSSGFRGVDLADPAHPQPCSGVNFAKVSRRLAVSDGLAVVTTTDGNVCTLDVTDPSSFLFQGCGPAGAADVDAEGDLAVVSNGGSGIQTVSLADPTAPVVLGSWNAPGAEAWGVALDGSRAYVADLTGGVRVLDVSDPASPAPLGSAPVLARDVAVLSPGSGTVAVAGDSTGLHIVDLADPENPQTLADEPTQGIAWRVAPDGSRLYVGSLSIGFDIFDVGTPESPSLLGSNTDPLDTMDLEASGDLLVLARLTEGLSTWNVASPSSPQKLAALSWYQTYGVELQGDLAWVATGADGLQAVDISDPASPEVVGVWDGPLGVNEVEVRGTLAYTLDPSQPLGDVIDLSDPAHPVAVGTIPYREAPVGPRRIAEQNGLLAIGDNDVLRLFTTECRAPQAGFGWEIWDREVHFTDRSLYGPSGWSWDFGDGATSQERNPVHTYAAPGSYTVTLTASNGFGSDTVSRTVVVWRPEDVSHDGTVSGPDLEGLVAEIFDDDGFLPADAWASTHRGAAYDDVDGDGVIGAGDLGAVLAALP